MLFTFRHPSPGPFHRYTAEAAASAVGQTFPLHIGEHTVEATATECEAIDDGAALWITVEVPDGAPVLDAFKPPGVSVDLG